MTESRDTSNLEPNLRVPASAKPCESVPSCMALATSRSIVLRSLLIAVVVGTILCAINHGNCLFSRKFNKACLLQSLLTAVVPYVVSVVSSIHAIRREALDRQEARQVAE